MSDDGPETFGRLIERYRCQARMAQGQLGKLIGVRSSYITSLENGEIWPEDHIIDQLVLVFGIPHEYAYAMLGQRPAANELKPKLI